MKLKPIGAIFSLAFVCAVCCLVAPVRAFAATAPTALLGTDSYEIALLSSDCPVEVERETLSFEIPEFPIMNDDGLSNVEEYNANVTAEYLLRNPTDEEVRVQVALPLGKRADYIPSINGEAPVLNCKESRYSLILNGEDLYGRLRFTYSESRSVAFNHEIEKLKTDSVDFYSADMPIEKYSCAVSFPSMSAAKLSERKYLLRLECDYNSERTHILAPSYSGKGIENGRMVINFRIGSHEDSFEFYVVGERAQISASVVEDYSSFQEVRKIDEASVSLRSEPIGEFSEFISDNKPMDEISDSDWFNIAAEYLSCDASSYGVTGCFPNEIATENLSRWLEYDFMIAAQESVVHTVTAPLYPTATTSGDYYYKYYFMPAEKWCSFGGIDIRIITPYTFESNLEFADKGDCFAFEDDSLPMGTLVLRFSSEGRSFTLPTSPYNNPFPALKVALTLLAVVVVCGAVILTVVLVQNNRRKKSFPEQKTRYGKTEDGFVDIDSHDGEE